MSAISIAPITLLAVGLSAVVATAQVQLYKPIPLAVGNPIKDALSDKDIPTGKKGFARDYIVKLTAGDKVTVSVTSDNFDPFVSLIAADGSVVEENDDGPDGSTNSLLVARITTTEDYIIRVRASGGSKTLGAFTLKVTKSGS
ncbi:MAG TPA: pre-peptidase C-terminal domain-containing protein [Waterburya sp.]|jgi:hypothetical protein